MIKKLIYPIFLILLLPKSIFASTFVFNLDSKSTILIDSIHIYKNDTLIRGINHFANNYKNLQNNKEIVFNTDNNALSEYLFTYYSNQGMRGFLGSYLIENNDSLIIDIKSDEDGAYDSITYSKNLNIKEFYNYYPKLYDKSIYLKLDTLSLSAYYFSIDSIYQSAINDLKKSSLFNRATITLQNFIIESLVYSNARAKVNRLLERHYYKNKINDEVIKYSDYLLKESEMNITPDFYSFNGAFDSYAVLLTNLALRRQSLDAPIIESNVLYSLRVINSYFKNAEFRDYLLHKFILSVFENFNVKDDFNLYENMKSYLDSIGFSTKRVAMLDLKVREYGVIMPGNKLNDYNLLDSLNNTIKLSSFKGKYLYINLWATWCGACYLYMEKEKELGSFFDSLEVTFLNISLEMGTKDIEKWKSTIAKKELKGVHLLFFGGFGATIMRDILCNSVPRYLLIGPDLEIIDINAATPLDDDFKEWLINKIELHKMKK